MVAFLIQTFCWPLAITDSENKLTNAFPFCVHVDFTADDLDDVLPARKTSSNQ